MALERAIRAHAGEWIEPQRGDAAERRDEALEAVEQLSAALERLGDSAGLVIALEHSPPRGMRGARTLKRKVIGFDASNTHQQPATALLGEIRAQIEQAVPEAPRELSEDEQREADELAGMQRRYRQMAGGGAAVVGR